MMPLAPRLMLIVLSVISSPGPSVNTSLYFPGIGLWFASNSGARKLAMANPTRAPHGFLIGRAFQSSGGGGWLGSANAAGGAASGQGGMNCMLNRLSAASSISNVG